MNNGKDRIAILEKRSRMFLAMNIVTIIGLLIIFLLKFAWVGTVKCKRLEVVDSNGVKRVELYTENSLYTGNPSSGIRINDSRNATRMILESQDKMVMVFLNDSNNRPRINLSVVEEVDNAAVNESILMFYDNDYEKVSLRQNWESKISSFALKGSGKKASMMIVTEEANPFFVATNSSGNIIWKKP